MIYPLLAFPNLYPTCPIDLVPEPLKSSILYALKRKCVPPAVALIDAIAAAGAVVHCGYDAETPDGEPMPTTVNTCCVAPSATGKGTSIKLFFAFFLQAQKKRGRRVVEKYEDMKAIKLQRNPVVESMINKLSFRALMQALDGEGMNLTIQREEGASFLKTDLFKNNTDAITQVWSGDPPLDHYVQGIELIAADARCSLGFRIQPDLFYPYLKRSGGISYKLGFWPRSIAGCHDPERFPWNETYSLSSMRDTRPDDYQRRASQLAFEINDRNKSGFAGRIRVKLDPEAKAFLIELGFRMKQWLNVYYADIREAAGRAWENTLRIAVVLHIFCAGQGRVSLNMVERAWAIVEWSLSQHRLIFIEAPRPQPETARPERERQSKPSQIQLRLCADAGFMLDAIGVRAHHYPYGKVPLNEILLLTGFDRTRFLRALAWLVSAFRVVVDGSDEYATVCLVPPVPIGIAYGQCSL